MALGIIPFSTQANAPKLALKTYFAGISVGSPTLLTSTNFWQYFTGVDSITGMNIVGDASSPIGAWTPYSQLLPDQSFTAGTVGTQLENLIQSTTMCANVPGAQELYQVQHTRNAAIGAGATPQNDFHIRRSPVGGVLPALPSLYMKKHIILPSGLTTAMLPSGCGFYNIFDWKTDNGAGYGDGRLAAMVYRDASNNFVWRMTFDNNANHNPATMTAVGSNGATGGYWQIRSPANSVIFGEELIVELEYVLPPLIWQKATTREPGAPSNGEFPYIRDLVNGRATLIVTRVSDGSQVILNQQGGVMTGAYNLPQGRLMANLTYCMGSFGSDPIMWSKCTGLEVWTRAPYQMIPS